jgi:hypothetical protein
MVDRTMLSEGIDSSIVRGEHPISEYQELKEMLLHYSAIQVQSDSIYQSRTNTITLTQGLLFVAVNSLSSIVNDNEDWRIALSAMSALGALLSFLWLLYEQRNLSFFKARAKVLRDLERRLTACAREYGFTFPEFWNKVPKEVVKQARWFERFSAQQVVRFWVPFVFFVAWIAIFLSANWSAIINGINLLLSVVPEDPYHSVLDLFLA